MCFFFFKQKTSYEMRISDWSSDVCSSDLLAQAHRRAHQLAADVDFGVANLFAQRDRPALVLVAAIGLDAGVKQIADRLQHRIRKGHVQMAAAAFEFDLELADDDDLARRSEGRRLGKEGVSTCKNRW